MQVYIITYLNIVSCATIFAGSEYYPFTAIHVTEIVPFATYAENSMHRVWLKVLVIMASIFWYTYNMHVRSYCHACMTHRYHNCIPCCKGTVCYVLTVCTKLLI